MTLVYLAAVEGLLEWVVDSNVHDGSGGGAGLIKEYYSSLGPARYPTRKSAPETLGATVPAITARALSSRR